jgi:hypothetical protein
VRWPHSLRVLVSHLERRGILVRDGESSQLHLQDEDSEDALGNSNQLEDDIGKLMAMWVRYTGNLS